MIQNSFREIEVNHYDTDTESGQAIATITLKSTHIVEDVQPISINIESGSKSYDNVDMDAVEIDGDTTSNWSNESNMYDETAIDPVDDPTDTPTTYASYSPNIATQTKYGSALLIKLPDDWANPDYATDGNDSTYTLHESNADADSCSIAMLVSGYFLTSLEDMFEISVGGKLTWTDKAVNPCVIAFFNGTSETITTISTVDWQDKIIFSKSEDNPVNVDMEDYFAAQESYQNGGENDLQLGFYCEHAHGNDDSVSVYEFRAVSKSTALPTLRIRNSDAVPHAGTTNHTKIYIYASGGTWLINYYDAWDGVAGAYHEMQISGWAAVEIPGSDTWGIDEQWQKWIRIKPKYRDQDEKNISCPDG